MEKNSKKFGAKPLGKLCVLYIRTKQLMFPPYQLKVLFRYAQPYFYNYFPIYKIEDYLFLYL